MDIRVHRVGAFDTNALGAAVKVLEDRSKSGVSPGLSYSLFDAGGIIAAGGYGDTGSHAVPGADTAFRIASCTKSFTAATALPTPASSVSTVRQLLSKSGGLLAPVFPFGVQSFEVRVAGVGSGERSL